MSAVPCPRCGALGREPCVTASGHAARDWHAGRLEALEAPGLFESACLRSLAAASWLTAADEFARTLVLAMGRSFDLQRTASSETQAMLMAPAEGEQPKEAATKLYYGAATILQFMDRLGLTPAGRQNLGIEEEHGVDELAEAIEEHGIELTLADPPRVSSASDMDSAG